MGDYNEINSFSDAEKAYTEFKKDNKWLWRGIKGGLVGAALLVTGFSGCYSIAPNEEGVIRRFGKYVRSQTPGLNWKLPYLETLDRVKVTEIKKQEFGFRTEKAGIQTTYAQKDYPEESLILTGDKSIVDLEFIVQYKVKSAKDYLFNVRNVDETLRDAAEAAMRMEIGDRGIDDALTSGRAEIQNEVAVRLQNIVDGYNSGIHILTVKLQDAKPPQQIRSAFNRVNEAKQERTKKVNDAWAQYNKVIPRSRGEAENIIKHAMAYELERVNRAKGDANKFNEIYSKYENDKSITKLRMYLETMTKIMPKFQEKLIIGSGTENSLLKLLNIDANGGSKK